MIKLITMIVLALHGLGHVMAPHAAFVPPGAFPAGARAGLTGMTIGSGAGRALSLLWLIRLAGILVEATASGSTPRSGDRCWPSRRLFRSRPCCSGGG